MEELIYKITNIDSLEQQIRVYMDSFGYKEEEYECIKRRWIKKHYQNPMGESYIFGAFDGSQLVGINCFLKMNYALNGKRINIVQSCESGVLNTHQRRGIWGKLMAYAKDYLTENTTVDMIIGFPNYRNSYPGFVKMGWLTLFNEKNYLLINKGDLAVQMYTGKHWWSCVGKILVFQRRRIHRFFNKGYSFLEVDTLNKPTKDGICLNTSREWIRWKKEYDSIIIYEVHDDESTIGYIVVQEDALNNITYLKILDVIATNEARDARIEEILSSFLRFIRKKDYSVIRGWSKEDEAYKKLGFIHMKKHLNPFIVMPLRKDTVLLDKELWNPTFMDLD